VSDEPVYTADEFGNEARYLDALIWEAIVVMPHSKVLVCGYGPDGAYVQRAIDAGAKVTVIEHRNDEINRFSNLDAKLLRGSTSVIPAKDNSFDLAISYHYLHEVDPFFHSQVLSELARVARRVAVIEPAPPADPLGKRIALLYSQAKRELGQFEYYQPLEYWKKLLQGVKADVSQHVFAFAKVPPREYLADTMNLMLDTIEIGDAPREYMSELRQIAQRSSAQLLPPPRYVLVGAAVGDALAPSFTPRISTRPSLPVAAPTTAPAPEAVPAKRGRRNRVVEVSAESGYELPPVEVAALTPPDTIDPAPAAPPAVKPAPAAAPPPPAPPARPTPVPNTPPPVAPPAPAFGLSGLPFGAPPPPSTPGAAPTAPEAPFGMPFATPSGLPPIPGAQPPGWAWEPPEGGEPPLP
jgi:ubiquinone/menaquinone biosynthesis C-methylase UbiE